MITTKFKCHHWTWRGKGYPNTLSLSFSVEVAIAAIVFFFVIAILPRSLLTFFSNHTLAQHWTEALTKLQRLS